jgi:hypothetical protein
MKAESENTGILFEPDGGHALNDCCTIFDCHGGGRNPLLPRSYASNGERWFLYLHVVLHLAAFATTLAGGVQLRSTHQFDNMLWLVGVTSGSHAMAIIILLGTAAWADFPTEYVLLTSFNFFLFLATGGLTCAQFALTVSTDPVIMSKVEHPLLYSGIFLQAAAFSCFLACVVNLAANGGQIARNEKYATGVYSTPDSKGQPVGRIGQLKYIRQYKP